MRRCDNGIPAFPKGERRLLNLPDCVFLTEQGRCRILRVPECTGETCSFCRIQQIEEKSIGASRRLYYVLKPVYHEDSTIFVPVDNPARTGKMHRLLRAQEVLQLLSGLAGDDGLWVEDEAQRREAYEQILRSGDRVGMARLIRALSLQKARLGAQRKKLHAAEETILKEAERELNEEFAYVLGLSLEETPAFIRNLIETDEESEEAFAAHWKEKNWEEPAMKRILSACLNQTILFSCKENVPKEWAVRSVREEYAAYLRQLDERKIRYRIVEEAAQADGSILLKIKRQNNQYDVGTYLDD